MDQRSLLLWFTSIESIEDPCWLSTPSQFDVYCSVRKCCRFLLRCNCVCFRIVLADKLHDDWSLPNRMWSAATQLPVRDVNRLERYLLQLLDYDVLVSPETFHDACYHVLSSRSPYSSLPGFASTFTSGLGVKSSGVLGMTISMCNPHSYVAFVLFVSSQEQPRLVY